MIVTATVVVLPIGSWLLSAGLGRSACTFVPSFEAWFLFWAVGIRLLIAGLRQAIQPSFTAQHIFEINDPKPMGSSGSWVSPTSVLVFSEFSRFLCPAGSFQACLSVSSSMDWRVSITSSRKKRTEFLAMISDLYAAAVLGAFGVMNALSAFHGETEYASNRAMHQRSALRRK